jgi:hypothetical protein
MEEDRAPVHKLYDERVWFFPPDLLGGSICRQTAKSNIHHQQTRTQSLLENDQVLLDELDERECMYPTDTIGQH